MRHPKAEEIPDEVAERLFDILVEAAVVNEDKQALSLLQAIWPGRDWEKETDLARQEFCIVHEGERRPYIGPKWQLIERGNV